MSLLQVLSKIQPAERLMLVVGSAGLFIDAVLIFTKGAQIDWLAYAALTALCLSLMAGGLFYRISERSERIATSLLCTGAFLYFSMALSLFNYAILPITRPPIDHYIIAADAMLGFHWPDVMAWAAENIVISDIMKFAYMTTVPQISLLVIILGLTGRRYELHLMITAVTMSATLTICFWGLFPSLGAKSYFDLPSEIWDTVRPIVNLEYIQGMGRDVYLGPELISPKEIRGLIAFPSYHAVLAFTAMWAARTVPWALPFFIIVNLAILPGIFIHGGHHLLDLPAGFVMFAVCAYLAQIAVNRDYTRREASRLVPA